VVLRDYLGKSPTPLTCPADERKVADRFASITNNFHISYFVGVGLGKLTDRSAVILGGDRNLAPGRAPQWDYGFSPASGKGNDVLLNGPACWSRWMHGSAERAGGHILDANGAVYSVSSEKLRGDILDRALKNAESRAHATNSVGIRLIFP